MGGLRVSNEVILAKTETVYGTDPVPTVGSNAILTRGVTFEREGLRMVERGAVRQSIGELQSIFGGTLARISFECEVKGSGTAGVAPEIGPLLEACGLEETVVADTSVTYKPESAAHESVTIYYFEGGRKRHILTGCRGNCTFRLEAGGIMVAAFEFIGAHTEPTDQALPSPTYNATVPKAALSMAVSLNGVTAITVSGWEWMLNNEVGAGPSVSTASGYGEVIIGKRKVEGSITLESELDSVIDIDTLLTQGTRFAFASGSLGATAGNIVNVTTPASSTYVKDYSPEEVNFIRQRRVMLGVDDSTPNQELSIAFT